MTTLQAPSSPPTYDLLCPDRLQNPYPLWAEMRAAVPIYWSEQLNSWVLTAYDDILAALHSPALSVARFESARIKNRKLSQVMAFLSHWLVAVDPPDHTSLRGLLSQAFTPQQIKTLRPRIQTLATNLIDAAAPQREMDVYADYAYPLPVQVIGEILGVPQSARDHLRRWSRAIVGFGGQGGAASLDRLHAAMGEMVTFFRHLIQQRRTTPGPDFISQLVQQQALSTPQAEEQIIANCAFLLFVGHDTIANAIQNGVFTYLQRGYPGQVDVEEILRFDTVVPHVVRVANRDIRLGDTTIRAGEQLTLFLGAANRDPQQFCAPDHFDGERDNQRHLSFGHGIHYCLGAALARQEIAIAIETLFTRLPDLRWTAAFGAQFGSAPIYRGTTLPVEF